MYKEQTSFVKEKKRKTSSKSSRKCDKNNQKNNANSSSVTAKSRSGNSSTSSYFGFGIRKTHLARNTFHANSAIETCTRSVWNIRAGVINVSVSVNTMVNRLLRDVDDDYCSMFTSNGGKLELVI
ncbi:hypothetical protein TNCV_2907331 [Trichonephila clavipes]|nr:hypothetical protein TNCV_2907331 [Trichonephila clavipes]